MHSYSLAFYELVTQLNTIYDAGEATAIAHEVLEEITGKGKLDRLTNKDILLTEAQEERYISMSASLMTAKPLQYVLGYTWFAGRKFRVDENVLIPRPETEELVQWILTDAKQASKQLSILDIGTGSGCIPVSLKVELANADVSACDISEGALSVAKQNAALNNVAIKFITLDFLNKEVRKNLSSYDIIVSNPPYIPITEQEQLHSNVKDHEPATALFVPGDDALLFYREIAEFGKTHLNECGIIYCELHTDYAEQTRALFEREGYSFTDLRKDMHGNPRMLKAAL